MSANKEKGIVDERAVEAAMTEPPHLPTTRGSASQQQIENMFNRAFAKAAEVHLNRRLNKALQLAALDRLRSPEGQAMIALRQRRRIQRQVLHAGIASEVIALDGDCGIRIAHKGIEHTCMSLQSLDATLTMITQDGAQ